MTTHTQQQNSTFGALQQLAAKLQQLTNNVSAHPLHKNDTSNLISEVETALVSLQIEQLHQQAIAQKARDFFPTPKSVIEKMLSLAQIKLGSRLADD